MHPHTPPEERTLNWPIDQQERTQIEHDVEHSLLPEPQKQLIRRLCRTLEIKETENSHLKKCANHEERAHTSVFYNPKIKSQCLKCQLLLEEEPNYKTIARH